MTPIRRLLNIVQFDLAEKLNLARLRWYHLNSSGPNLDTFIPGNLWEHYCKYELHKHPFHTNEKEYLILLLAQINMNK